MKYRVTMEMENTFDDIEADDENEAYQIAWNRFIMETMPGWGIEEIEEEEDEE